jgi:hypothetical protein
MSAEVVFLGIIALATLVMAVLQTCVVFFAARMAQQAAKATGDLHRDLQPIIAGVRQVTDDAVRATAIGLAQVQRVDAAITNVTERVAETVEAVRDVVNGPVRQGAAVVAGIQAALAMFKTSRTAAKKPDDDEDAMFVG